MPRIKKGSRSRRRTQETKDRIAEGMRKFRAKQREEALKTEGKRLMDEGAKTGGRGKKKTFGLVQAEGFKTRKKLRELAGNPSHDTLGFRMSDTRANLIVFPIKDIVPGIIFDFERGCIKIELGNVFGLTSGNLDRETMKNLAMVLNRNYNPRKRDRLSLIRKLKFPEKRKAILERVLRDIVKNDE